MLGCCFTVTAAASHAFRDVLKAYGIASAMSRRQAKDEAIAWLFRCNKARLHSTLAYVSPV